MACLAHHLLHDYLPLSVSSASVVAVLAGIYAFFIAPLNMRFDKIETKLDTTNTKFETRFDTVNTKLDRYLERDSEVLGKLEILQDDVKTVQKKVR